MLVSALAFVAAPWGAAQTQPVDLVLNNGAVITVDARDSVAEAVAITGGKIVAVGSNARVKAFIGEKTQVIDLHGRTATPGLIDTHVHFAEAADVLDLGDPSIKNRAFAASAGTRGNSRSGATSPPPTSTRPRPTGPCT
jgi:imidazolonepropionase-like amidohydrolase